VAWLIFSDLRRVYTNFWEPAFMSAFLTLGGHSSGKLSFPIMPPFPSRRRHRYSRSRGFLWTLHQVP